MFFSVIAAVSTNGVIGNQGRLPWDLPAERQLFRQLTWGHVLVCGRRTLQSIPGQRLAGRDLVVLSQRPDTLPDGVTAVCSMAEAIGKAGQLATIRRKNRIFVIGGTKVYRQFMDMAQEILISRIHAFVHGDARFPPIDPRQWRLHSKLSNWRVRDALNAFSISREVFIRR